MQYVAQKRITVSELLNSEKYIVNHTNNVRKPKSYDVEDLVASLYPNNKEVCNKVSNLPPLEFVDNGDGTSYIHAGYRRISAISAILQKIQEQGTKEDASESAKKLLSSFLNTQVSVIVKKAKDVGDEISSQVRSNSGKNLSSGELVSAIYRYAEAKGLEVGKINGDLLIKEFALPTTTAPMYANAAQLYFSLVSRGKVLEDEVNQTGEDDIPDIEITNELEIINQAMFDIQSSAISATSGLNQLVNTKQWKDTSGKENSTSLRAKMVRDWVLGNKPTEISTQDFSSVKVLFKDGKFKECLEMLGTYQESPEKAKWVEKVNKKINGDPCTVVREAFAKGDLEECVRLLSFLPDSPEKFRWNGKISDERERIKRDSQLKSASASNLSTQEMVRLQGVLVALMDAVKESGGSREVTLDNETYRELSKKDFELLVNRMVKTS